jgi:excisionase family DNA binding protein
VIEFGLEVESMEITPVQAASLLGKSERTIQRWIKLGKLPAHQLTDKSYRVKTEDLERFQQQSDETLLARIEVLEQEVARLVNRIGRIEALEQEIAELRRRIEETNVRVIYRFGELEDLVRRVDALSHSQR